MIVEPVWTVKGWLRVRKQVDGANNADQRHLSLSPLLSTRVSPPPPLQTNLQTRNIQPADNYYLQEVRNSGGEEVRSGLLLLLLSSLLQGPGRGRETMIMM